MINPDLIMFEVTLDNVKEEVKNFYDQDKYHHITVNAFDTGENLTIDWIFSEYGVKNKMYVFRAEGVEYKANVPTISDIVVSAWVSENDLADMFNLNIEETTRGMFLEPEAPQGPLLKETYNGK